MRKLVKKLLVLGSICCLSLCACGEERQEESKGLSSKQDKPIMVTNEQQALEKFTITDSGYYISFATADDCEIFYFFEVKNITKNKVINDLMYTVTLTDKDTKQIVATDQTSLQTLAPGETGIMHARIYGSTEDIKNTDVNVEFNSMKYDDKSKLSGFKQSDLEISDVSVTGDDDKHVLVSVTNNSNSSPNLGEVRIIGKRGGECIAYAYKPLAKEDMTPSTQHTYDISSYESFPTDCDDYLVFVDYY